MNTKTRNIIGWVLTAVLAFLFISSAVMKLSGSAESIKNAAHLGLSPKKFMFLGVTEIISIILFIIPRTGTVGTLLIAAYMGGAIATHLKHFLPPTIPVL